METVSILRKKRKAKTNCLGTATPDAVPKPGWRKSNLSYFDIT